MTYEKQTVDGRTIWVPKDQEPVKVPPQPQKKSETKTYPVQKTGKRFLERKRWY